MSTIQVIFDDGYRESLEVENVKRWFLDHKGFMHVETNCGGKELMINMDKVQYVIRE